MMVFQASARAYAHIDCNSFFASCEVLRNPLLKGKCVCVGDQLIIAASYEAKRRGIKTATPMWEAERMLGKDLVKILPDHAFYGETSRKLMSYMAGVVGDIEQFSVDEFFTEVTHLADARTEGGYERLAEKLKNDIYRDIGLPVSVGISSTRIRAKMFSEINKPFGSYVSFDRTDIEGLLSDLPVRAIPYIARGNSERLGGGIKTAYDFYALPPEKVREVLGKNGFTLWLELHGADVWTPHDATKRQKSLSATRSFNREMTAEYHTLWRYLAANLERAYDALLRDKQETRVVSVMLKDKDFRIFWESADLGDPTIDRAVIGKAARALFDRVFDRTNLYRTTGVRFDELRPYVPKQLSVFDIENRAHAENDSLATAMEKLKRLYGKDVVHRGLVTKNRESSGLAVLFEA